MAKRKAREDVCYAALARDLKREAGAWERVGQTVRARRLRGRIWAILTDELPCTDALNCYEACPVRRERVRLGLV